MHALLENILLEHDVCCPGANHGRPVGAAHDKDSV